MPKRLDSLHVGLLLLVLFLSVMGTWGWLRQDDASGPAPSRLQDDETSSSTRPEVSAPARQTHETTQAPNPVDSPNQPAKRETPVDSPKDGGSIWGRVLTPDGTPAANIKVVATDSLLSRGRPTFSGMDYLEYERRVAAYSQVAKRLTFQTVTDNNGEFRIEGLNSARIYHVLAGDWDTAMAWSSNTAPGTELQLVLKAFGSIRGSVTIDGAPCSSFELVMVGPSGPRSRTDRRPMFSEDGRFQLRMGDGDYRVWAESEGRMSAEATSVKIAGRAIEVNLTMRPASDLTLFVTDQSGVPLSGLLVNLGAGSGNTSEFARAQGFGISDVYIDTKGFARVRTLAPGRYKATVQDGNRHALGSQEFDVVVGSQQVEIRVDLGWSFTASVVNEKGMGVDVGEMYLRASDDGPEPVNIYTNTPGKRIFRRVAAGMHTLNMTLQDGTKVLREINIIADGGSETVVLRSRGTLKGKLLPTGEGIVAGCNLRLTNDTTKNKDSGIVRVDPGPDGQYELGPVETGSYTLIIRNPHGRSVVTETVVIAEGDNLRDFTLDTLASIKITLVSTEPGFDPERAPVWLSGISTERNTETLYSRNGAAIQRGFITPGSYLVLVNDRTYAATPQVVTLGAGITEVEMRVGKANALVLVRSMPRREGEAPLQPGDLIIEVAGHAIASGKDLNEARKDIKGGELFDVVIERDGKRMSVRITVNDLSETAPAFRP